MRITGGTARYRTLSVAWLPALALAFCAFFLAPDCASACSCAAPAGTSPQELTRAALSGSDAAFVGEVIGIEGGLGPIMRSDAPETVTLRVSEAWKGAGRETVEVKTAAYEESCGYPFDEGESYLVFASKGTTYGGGGLEVALCGSTQPLPKAEKALAALGPGATPAGSPPAGEGLPDTSGALPGLPPSVLLFGAGALVFVVSVWSSGRR